VLRVEQDVVVGLHGCPSEEEATNNPHMYAAFYRPVPGTRVTLQTKGVYEEYPNVL
jgi:hypothetical protein